MTYLVCNQLLSDVLNNLPMAFAPVVIFVPSTCTQSSACEREECSFMLVDAV